MDYHIDHEVRLSEDSEHKSLYSWSLQEFSKDGKKIGSDQIPWAWNLYFTASELRYNKSIRLELADKTDGKAELYKPAEESESLSATLHPGICQDGEWLERQTTFSMFGTNRRIENFTLGIYRLDDADSNERCNVWGCVSYTTDIDFHNETMDDVVIIHIWLSSKKFDDLREMARNQSVDMVQVRLGGVSGFYSEWSPSISTNTVKVLASGEEQTVVCPIGCEIAPPRLGTVGQFELSAARRSRLNPKQDLRPVDIGKLFAEKSEEQESALIEESVRELTDRNSVMLAQLDKAEHAVRRLSTPLWIIVILLLVLLFR